MGGPASGSELWGIYPWLRLLYHPCTPRNKVMHSWSRSLSIKPTVDPFFFYNSYLHLWVLHWGLQTLAPMSNTFLQHNNNTHIRSTEIQTRGKTCGYQVCAHPFPFVSYTAFCCFSMADWHGHLFCLFGCFHTWLLSTAISGLWSRLSWSLGATVAPSGILLELYSVLVELIDNMKLLSGLHFDHIVLTHHHRIYGGGVQAQLWNKTRNGTQSGKLTSGRTVQWSLLQAGLRETSYVSKMGVQ